jgi:hypothetical protein
MHNTPARIRLSLAVAVLGLVSVAIGCGENANPVRPDSVSAAGTAPASEAAANDPAVDHALITQAAAEPLSPAILTSRGWSCFEPIPNRIVCSHPHQGFPTFGNPPPTDGPPSFSFFIFDDGDHFIGTEHQIRADLYQGQLCGSTGRTYDFVPVIGYYECIHPVGR